MKKIIALTLTVLLVLSVVAPAVALAEGTSVDVVSGANPPIVKCKWEEEPGCPNYESGDPSHLTPGFQINPPLQACTTKEICYYAVVTDPDGVATVDQVFVDVYHPQGSPEPYGPSETGGIQNLEYFKYEVPMVEYLTGDAAEAVVQAASDMGLITWASGYDLAEVLGELDKGTAWIWKGCAEIDYEQPAGDYDVYAYAVDIKDGFSDPLHNQFLYVPTCGIEVDFTAIDFGSTNLGVEKMIAGDTIWDCVPGINHATVRNIGNTWTNVTVTFDDMGFDKDYYGDWNVQFDARMGSDNYYYEGDIMPYETRMLTNALDLSCKDELDFSIKVIKGTGSHSGVITLGCEIYPFDCDPANVVSISAREDCCDN